MKLNTDKCHLIISCFKHKAMWAKIVEDVRWERSNVQPLGVTIDNNLGFDEHVWKGKVFES